MNEKFQISKFAINDVQKVKLLYNVNSFRESERYPGTYSTTIEHNGVEKYWNMSGYIVDTLSKLGVEAGNTVHVRREDGDNGKTYTKVTLPGDILDQPQNVRSANHPKARVEHVPLPPIPPEYQNDPKQNKSIIRGQIATHLIAAYVSKEGLKVPSVAEIKNMKALIGLCLNPDVVAEAEKMIDVGELPF